MDYEKPNDSVDVVMFTLVRGRLCVLLSIRTAEPYLGMLALPGGYVHINSADPSLEDESIEATAVRVLREKLSMDAPYIEQLYTFSGRKRDPRGWSMSVAYYALLREGDRSLPAGAVFMPVDALDSMNPPLPFDHMEIVAMAVQRLRGKTSYSGLPLFLLPEEFTLGELQTVYEAVLGETLPKASFRRRMEEQGLVRELGRTRLGQANRPAQLYRAA